MQNESQLEPVNSMHDNEIPTSISKDNRQTLVYAFLRLCTYASIVIINLLIIYYDAENKGLKAFREDSLTEYTQEFFLFITSAIFFYLSRKDADFKQLGFCLSASFLLMLIREFDGIFDEITHGFWKLPALIVILIILNTIIRYRTIFISNLARFTEHRGFGTFTAGLLFALLYSALFGHGELWKTMMGDNYIRVIKCAVQEGLELLGYSFLLVSAIDYLLIKK